MPVAALRAVGLGVPAAFLLAFSNGANDIANSMGTVVGAEAMTMRQALITGSIFEFVGAMAIGPFVASSIAGGQLHTFVFDDDPTTFALVMLSALVGAGGTTLLATLYGYPISATHGVISGIIAVALCTGKPGVLDTSGFIFTLFGWVASPVVGMLAGMLVSAAIHFLIISKPNPAVAAAAQQPLLLTLTVAISFLFVLLKGPPLITRWLDKRYWFALVLSLAGGLATQQIRALWLCLLPPPVRPAIRLHDESWCSCEMGKVSSSSNTPPAADPGAERNSDRSDKGADSGNDLLEEGGGSSTKCSHNALRERGRSFVSLPALPCTSSTSTTFSTSTT